ncbi:MAG: succinate dehydrogenase assembly factor 2 [Paracoccaceae bacterium]
MSEDPIARLKRLKMRSMRRGIKEMDLILSAFADRELSNMSDAQLHQYDAMLNENDQDLYTWVSGQSDPPQELFPLILKIKSGLPQN